MKVTSRTTVAAVVLALIAAACGSVAETTTTTVTEPPDVTTTTEVVSDSPPTTLVENDMMIGVGVDPVSKVINLGLLADLTGPFAASVTDVVDAQRVYWQKVNDAGGVEGWTIELVVEDTNLSVDRHRESYQIIRDEVLAISQSSGSSPNLGVLSEYIADDMLVIPLSWYSGWAIPSIDRGVMLEQNTNYCIEAMNILDFIDGMAGETIAVAAFDDDYGRDATAGVRLGADFYGMTVVYEGTVDPGRDFTEVAQGIIESGADWTVLATNASLGAEILAATTQSRYEGRFVGAQPSYDFRLLDSATALLYDTLFYQSVYTVAWGDKAPGNVAMMRAMADAFPDRRPADAFIVGWNEAITMHRVLEAAIAARDLTRNGVVRAANLLDGISFGDSTPDQSYLGAPTEYVQRASAIYKPDLATYLAAGGKDQTLAQSNATTGSEVVRDFFVGAAAADFEFSQPCS